MAEVEHMLTTIDNPYSPFLQWDEWYAYDTLMGHNTCGLLARITRTSEELSEIDQAMAVEAAIEEIVRENVSGVHMRVSRTS